VTELRPAAAGSRTRVALVNDHEIVVLGLAGMLAPYADRLNVVELAAGRAAVDRRVDVALFDTYGRPGLGLARLAELVADPDVRHVAVFTAAVSDALARRALDAGATGFLPKSLAAAELVDALVRVGRGDAVVISEPGRRRRPNGSWPGQSRGLTERESELLGLVAMGLRNDEIAQALFVTSNTVKSHLKNVFRKLAVRNRAEAAAVVAADPSFLRRPSPPARYHPGTAACDTAG
jgi:DNA-binding NarL/FixJ family response regulator